MQRLSPYRSNKPILFSCRRVSQFRVQALVSPSVAFHQSLQVQVLALEQVPVLALVLVLVPVLELELVPALELELEREPVPALELVLVLELEPVPELEQVPDRRNRHDSSLKSVSSSAACRPRLPVRRRTYNCPTTVQPPNTNTPPIRPDSRACTGASLPAKLWRPHPGSLRFQ